MHPTAPPPPAERSRAAYPLAALVLAAWLRRVAPPDDRGRDRPTAISAWFAERGVEVPPVTVRHWLRGKLPHPATLDAVAPLVASPREYERLLAGLYSREQP